MHVGLLTTLLGVTDPDVTEGLLFYERLKFDRAVVTLGRALAKPLPGEDRVAALETLAFAYAVLGDARHAESTFHLLLDGHPNHALPSTLSPRLKGAFEEAKRSWLEGRRIMFILESPLDQGELRGRLDGGDPNRIGVARSRDRDGRMRPLSCRARECRGELPSTTFFVELCDPLGTILHTAGPFEPLPREGGPLATAWWWAAAAALALSGGIAISIALGRGEPPEGSLGRLKLP